MDQKPSKEQVFVLAALFYIAQRVNKTLKADVDEVDESRADKVIFNSTVAGCEGLAAKGVKG